MQYVESSESTSGDEMQYAESDDSTSADEVTAHPCDSMGKSKGTFGLSRQISDEDTESSFSEDFEDDLQSLCADDMLPASGSQTQRVQIRLAKNPSMTSTIVLNVEDRAAKLKQAISEATGVAVRDVALLVSSRGRCLSDDETIPPSVTVSGVDNLPEGGLLLSEEQFINVFEEFRDLVACWRASDDFDLDAHMTFSDMISQAVEEVMPEHPRISGEDMAAFYYTSNFSKDVQLRTKIESMMLVEMDTIFGTNVNGPKDMICGA
jgi:hypothetical protein